MKITQAASALVDVQTVVSVIEDVPDNDKVLACAYEGKADFIVNGDAHLLTLQEDKGITIDSPQAFLGILEGPLSSENTK